MIKKAAGVLAVLVPVLAVGVQGENAYRTFTTPDGRSLEARVLESSSNGKIQLERKDGKKVWVLPTVFVDEDQAYVQQWQRADQFLSAIKFKIDGDSDKGKKTEGRGSGTVSKQEKQQITYTITLENRTDFPLTDLKIEYRAFIEVRGYEGRPDSRRVEGGSLTVSRLPAGAKVSKKLKPVYLITDYKRVTEYSSYSSSYSSYDKKTNQDSLKGFWVKVRGPELDGVRVLRQWCYPSDTMEDFGWGPITETSGTASPGTTDALRAVAAKRKTFGIGPGSVAKENPEEGLKLMKEEYAKSSDPEIAKNIGYTYLWYVKPADIDAGLGWLKKSAADDNESACRLLTGFYSTYYGHKNRLDVEQAVKYGEQALSLQVDDMPHMTMALAYARSGQFDKAVEHQQKAVSIFKENMKKRKSSSSADYIDKLEKILEGMENKLDLYKKRKVE